MKWTRLAITSTSLGLLLALALGSTASAYETISESGNRGEWGSSPTTADSETSPGAKCGYAAPDDTGFAHLAWIRVFPFKALAFNSSGGVDQQQIREKVTLQRSTDGGTTWKKLSSLSQTRTATDSQSASFSTLKLATTGKQGSLYRALVTLQWLKGSRVDGMAKVRIEFYGVEWTVGDPAFIYENACDGAAD